VLLVVVVSSDDTRISRQKKQTISSECLLMHLQHLGEITQFSAANDAVKIPTAQVTT